MPQNRGPGAGAPPTVDERREVIERTVMVLEEAREARRRFGQPQRTSVVLDVPHRGDRPPEEPEGRVACRLARVAYRRAWRSILGLTGGPAR